MRNCPNVSGRIGLIMERNGVFYHTISVLRECETPPDESFSPSLLPSFSFLLSIDSSITGICDSFRHAVPPSYPNQVYCLQCGPRTTKISSCKPVQARERPAAARQPCSLNTFVPTAVPMI